MGIFASAKKNIQKAQLLSGGETLLKAFSQFVEEYGVDTIVFDEPVNAVIGADVDPHRGTRCGYMTYDEAHILRFGGKVWVVVLGRKTGYHPGNSYTAEIAAVELTGVSCDEFLEQLIKRLEKSFNERLFRQTCDVEYFYNTLVLANRSGELEGGDAWRTRFGGRYRSNLLPKMEDATSWEEYYDSGSSFRASGTRRRVVGYKSKAVGILAEFMRETLSK